MKKTSFVALAIVGLSLAFMLTGCARKSDVITITIFNNTVEPYHFWGHDGKCSARNKVEPGSNITIRKWASFETNLIDGKLYGEVWVHVGQDGTEVYSQEVIAQYPSSMELFNLYWDGNTLKDTL